MNRSNDVLQRRKDSSLLDDRYCFTPVEMNTTEMDYIKSQLSTAKKYKIYQNSNLPSSKKPSYRKRELNLKPTKKNSRNKLESGKLYIQRGAAKNYASHDPKKNGFSYRKSGNLGTGESENKEKKKIIEFLRSN